MASRTVDRGANEGPMRLELGHGVTDPNDPADEDVGIDPSPMGELLDDSRPRHLLQVPTRLAELHAQALDLPDAEALADEGVHVDVAYGDLPSRFSRLQSDALDLLGCDERQRLARRSSIGMEMAVSFQPLARHGSRGLDRPQFRLVRSSEVDRLDRHRSMMPEPSVGPLPLRV